VQFLLALGSPAISQNHYREEVSHFLRHVALSTGKHNTTEANRETRKKIAIKVNLMTAFGIWTPAVALLWCQLSSMATSPLVPPKKPLKWNEKYSHN
jgi:hypothetical protein